MIDWWIVVPGFFGGVLIGLLFFTSLRWTIQRLYTAQRPALFMLTSFILRTAIALVGFYLVAGGSWQRLLLAAVGFLIGRVVIVNLMPIADETATREAKS